jgi:hypothetical protein
LGNSTVAHREGARQTARSQRLAPRTHFNASRSLTASGFQCFAVSDREQIRAVGIWKMAPRLLGRLVNKRKWLKNFQNVIYTQVCGARHLLYTDVCLRRNELDSTVNFRAFLNAPLLAINISATIAFRHTHPKQAGHVERR